MNPAHANGGVSEKSADTPHRATGPLVQLEGLRARIVSPWRVEAKCGVSCSLHSASEWAFEGGVAKAHPVEQGVRPAPAATGPH